MPVTLIEVAEILSHRSLERSLDEAEFLGLLDRRELDGALERHSGRDGAARVAGGASHNRAAARERDSRRDAWLVAADFRPLRFTWLQVTKRPDEVLAALEAALR